MVGKKIPVMTCWMLLFFFIPMYLLSSKELKKMSTYKQPFSNYQLNSYCNAIIHSCGKFNLRINYTPKRQQVYYSIIDTILLLNEKNLLIDTDGKLIAIDFNNKIIMGEQKKDAATYAVLNDDGKFSYFQKFVVYTVNIDTLFNKNCHAAEEENIEQLKNQNIGYSTALELNHGYLTLLSFNNEEILTASNSDTYPQGHEYIFAIKLKKVIKKYFTESIYSQHFKNDRPAAKPTVSFDNRIYIPQTNIIRVINLADGKIEKTIKLVEDKFVRERPFYQRIFDKSFIERVPLWASIGPDNILYVIYEETKYQKINKDYVREDNTILHAFELSGATKWTHKIYSKKPNQPPIVSKDGSVYIIGSTGIEAFKTGKRLWLYPLLSNPRSQLATVFEDGKLLISDNNRVINLSPDGKPVWIYEGKKDEVFITQPIVDSKGRVFVATDTDVVILE